MKLLHSLFQLAAIAMLPRCDVKAFTIQGTHPTTKQATSVRTISVALTASRSLVEIGNSNYRDLFCGDKPVLIDACAQWCGPCKLIEPVLERCAEQRKDSLTICKFDVGSDHNDVKVELLLKGVMPRSLPALILVHRNEVLATWKGVINDNQLEGMLDEHLSHAVFGRKEIPVPTAKAPSQQAGYVSFAMSGGDGDDYMLKHI